jgi:hypothetical protein
MCCKIIPIDLKKAFKINSHSLKIRLNIVIDVAKAL